MTIHTFAKSLARSHIYADAPWWEETYREFFPGFASMVCVRDDGWAQRGGIDRVITLRSGRTITGGREGPRGNVGRHPPRALERRGAASPGLGAEGSRVRLHRLRLRSGAHLLPTAVPAASAGMDAARPHLGAAPSDDQSEQWAVRDRLCGGAVVELYGALNAAMATTS